MSKGKFESLCKESEKSSKSFEKPDSSPEWTRDKSLQKNLEPLSPCVIQTTSIKKSSHLVINLPESKSFSSGLSESDLVCELGDGGQKLSPKSSDKSMCTDVDGHGELPVDLRDATEVDESDIPVFKSGSTDFTSDTSDDSSTSSDDDSSRFSDASSSSLTTNAFTFAHFNELEFIPTQNDQTKLGAELPACIPQKSDKSAENRRVKLSVTTQRVRFKIPAPILEESSIITADETRNIPLSNFVNTSQ